ncbi:galactitol-1-phosphate 5-dehydrogenase [Bryobacterales bacterium F-183]|nr:galactitol-1-phosphate 5-dehydrogenase [Bryobacterales bacterium F-183]
MKALLLTDYKKLEYTDVPEPVFGPDDILIKVRACGICGSDIHGFDGSSGRRKPPLIMGHEASGEVAALGSNVKGFAEGDRVTFDAMVNCGNCYFCAAGDINLCDNRQVVGVSPGEYRRHGAFAEYVVIPRRVVHKLPEGLRFEHAAMAEPVSIVVHAANLAPKRLGQTAVVVGSGMIGLLGIQALKAAGYSTVYAVDLEDRKLDLAVQLGAAKGFNPKKTDVVAEIRELTSGRGVDHAMECVGATAPIETSIQAVRKGGVVTLVGNITPRIDFNLQSVVTREISLYGSCSSRGEYPQCIDMIANGTIKVQPIISAMAPLSEGAGYFDRLYGHDPELLKVILQPQ